MRRSTWHVRTLVVVVGWLVAALVAGFLSLSHDVSTWLLVHLLLLGAVSNAILIWSSHFSAAMLRLPTSTRHAEEIARLVLFNVGAVAVVIGMTAIDVPMTAWFVAIAGGAVVAEVAIWHAIDLMRRIRRALPSRFGSTVRYYVVAAALLPLGIIIGLLMAPDDLPENRHAQLALAHVSINLLGWVGITVVGTLVTLWPTILHTQVAPTAERAARRALPILAVSVLALAGGALLGSRPISVVAVAGYLAGLCISGAPRVAEARRRPPTTFATLSVLAAAAWFVGCIVALGAILVTAPDWEEAAETADRLGLPLLLGFAAQLLVGALSFLVPVVLGGGPSTARATNRILNRFTVLRLALLNVALVVALIPVSDAVRQASTVIAGLALASFLPLVISAVLIARRSTPELPLPHQPTAAS